MFDHHEVSKHVNFYRRHQRVPLLDEVHAAYEKALNGDIRGAIELLNWRRHCFHVKNEYEVKVMNKIFELSKQVIL